MITEVLRSNLQVFLDLEKSYTKRGLEASWCNDDAVIGNAIQRALGACTFAELCGLPYAEMEATYENFKHELEEMRNEMR